MAHAADFIKDLIRIYLGKRVSRSAAELSYFLTLSVFPTLMCLYEDALGGCVHSPQNLMDLTEWIRDKIGKDEFAV